ncbi:Fe(3+) ions import ATP-binding protein FbpC 2 [Corynebacterium atrinae]|uniref:ABC transporter ATP-binding protein n=1 Tax=Corynebacterium atrinae TaxID=1336740 RepID=UPI0025B3D84A|nr:ABC transporter ATP-binding protein [Corynebacterium atrinae]WJY64049.1 Fe(3+) ions import ATP-binding protein FbpC 2 [Corynebacterium atrinae]
MTSALTVSGLSARYPGSDATVLHEVNLDVPEGELLAVLGPSGCGKSTLLRVLAGLMPATAGTVDLAGRRVVDGPTGVAPEHRNIGLVPQDPSLFPHLDVAANVGFGLGRRRRSVPERVTELLDVVGIPELAHRRPDELSGGQAQRVSLARALAPNPDLVLLDEPFSALDAALRVRLRSEIRGILAARGATGLLVTHDQDEALSTADRVAIINAGRIIQCGTPEEVYSRPATAWVAEFVGTCSLLRGVNDGHTVTSVFGTFPTPSSLPTGEVLVVVRPEQVRVVEDGELGVEAVVAAIEYSGHSTRYLLRSSASGEEITAREFGPARHAVGEKVTVAVSERLHAVAR